MKRSPWRKKAIQSFAALLFGLGIWQATALLIQSMRGVPFPAPADCLSGLARMLGGAIFLNHTIYHHILASCLRWGQGFITAFTMGIVYAFVVTCRPALKAISMPTVEVLQLIPGLAWVPVAILLLGLNPAASVVIIVLTTFPIVAVAGVMGFGCVEAPYIHAGRMCGYGLFGLFRTVYLPYALPHLLSGTRIAIGSSWRVLVAAEMVVGSGNGLGYAIIQSRWTMDYVSAFVCIGIIAAIGLILERLLLLPLERRIRRYGKTDYGG